MTAAVHSANLWLAVSRWGQSQLHLKPQFVGVVYHHGHIFLSRLVIRFHQCKDLVAQCSYFLQLFSERFLLSFDFVLDVFSIVLEALVHFGKGVAQITLVACS